MDKTARIVWIVIILAVLLTLMVSTTFSEDLSYRGVKFNPFPRIWFGTNSDWTDHTVTTQPETVIETIINKKSNNSLLKVSFSGGRLSFITDEYNLN